MTKIAINNTVLSDSNKKGILKPDSDGYYSVTLGCLNIENSGGQYYPYKQNKAMFEPNSILQRRIRNGQLFAELGHPKRESGMSDSEWVVRVLRIEETNIAAHIKEVWLDEDYTDLKGNKYVGIIGKVKPAGPHKETLQEYLETPDINVAFSVRSFTHLPSEVGMQNIKVFKNIITWDVVTEPGIATATKWDSPNLEDINTEETVIVTPSMVKYAKEYSRDEYTVESVEELLDSSIPSSKEPIWAKY